MKFVYLIESLSRPGERYVGLTDDVEKRMRTHNAGGSPHTFRFKPWKLLTYIAFSNARRAAAFERYLKSGSGQMFARRHLA